MGSSNNITVWLCECLCVFVRTCVCVCVCPSLCMRQLWSVKVHLEHLYKKNDQTCNESDFLLYIISPWWGVWIRPESQCSPWHLEKCFQQLLCLYDTKAWQFHLPLCRYLSPRQHHGLSAYLYLASPKLTIKWPYLAQPRPLARVRALTRSKDFKVHSSFSLLSYFLYYFVPKRDRPMICLNDGLISLFKLKQRLHP